MAKSPMEEFYKRVPISMVDVAKSGARVSSGQHFTGTLSAIARDHLGKKPLHESGEARASVKTVRSSVKPAVFTHISFATARVRAKEDHEHAMCWCRGRIS